MNGVEAGDLVSVVPMMQSGLKGAQITKLAVKSLETGSADSQSIGKASDRLLLAYLKQNLGSL